MNPCDRLITSTSEGTSVGVTHASAPPGRFTAAFVFGVGPERQQIESELVRQNPNFSFSHRLFWASLPGAPTSWLLFVRGSDTTVAWGFALEVTRSRALPGHFLLRAERVRPSPVDGVVEAALTMLAKYARSNARILRVSLEWFSPRPEEKSRIAQIAANLGFQKLQQSRMYTETLVIDLRPSENEIFAFFHGTARRHIRAASKQPLCVQPVTDAIYSERMANLWAQTMARTGGTLSQPDWANIIALSSQYPELSRVTGLFRTEIGGPDSLLAFAWARHHGDHADYAAAASTRDNDPKMPLGYALAWDLMRWAKRNGAAWFDFGGVTPGTFGSDDPLGGVSDFKRYFGQAAIPVGEEWVLEPHPLRASVANTISACANLARKLFP